MGEGTPWKGLGSHLQGLYEIVLEWNQGEEKNSRSSIGGGFLLTREKKRF